MTQTIKPHSIISHESPTDDVTPDYAIGSIMDNREDVGNNDLRDLVLKVLNGSNKSKLCLPGYMEGLEDALRLICKIFGLKQ